MTYIFRKFGSLSILAAILIKFGLFINCDISIGTCSGGAAFSKIKNKQIC